MGIDRMKIKEENKGLAIVAVLWVSVLLSVIVTAVSRDSMFDTKLCLAGMEGIRCKWAGRAGIETATAVLSEDINGSDSLKDIWGSNTEDFNNVLLERSYFKVKVYDESGKININTASLEQLMKLPNMTEAIAAAIIDWRDGNNVPSENGAEAEYYENLRYGYMIRNGRFRTIRELLMVKGVTENLLYGEDTNDNGILDVNERDGEMSPPYDNRDEYLDLGWIAYLTCYSYDLDRDGQGQRRVNINQAREQQLVNDLGISSGQAKWIVDNRSNGFGSIADLINDNSPKAQQGNSGSNSSGNSSAAEAIDLGTFSKIADKITVSNSGRIRGLVNINTASKGVLTALFGGEENAENMAAGIVAYRDTLYEGMSSISDVLNANSMTVAAFKKVAKYLTVRSNVYTVRSLATADRNGKDGARFITEAVVDRSSTPCRVLYWYQGVNN